MGYRLTLRQLAVFLLSVVFLTGCEGDGMSSPDVRPGELSGQERDGRRQESAAPQQEAPMTAAVQEAIVDLGLVDPSQAVRLDVASNGYGLLSVEQFSVALIDEAPAVRQAAVDAVIGAPEQILRERLESLKYALTDPDEAVRESVVAALAGLDDPRSIALLLEAQGDSSPLVSEEAREALARLQAVNPSAAEVSLHPGD